MTLLTCKNLEIRQVIKRPTGLIKQCEEDPNLMSLLHLFPFSYSL